MVLLARRRLLAVLAGTALAACGRKPGFVDPPEGVEVDTFPRSYPLDDLPPLPEPPPGGFDADGRRIYPPP